jgi:nitrous oxide reductase accessory protein NosL
LSKGIGERVKPVPAAAVLAFLLISRSVPAAEPPTFEKPGVRERCPVCGMFVEKFPEWWAQVVFTDGGRVTFDGVKDLVRYLGAPQRFTPGRTAAALTQIWVIDYYSVLPLPAESAFFVAGSDVSGPMGREFVPFRNRLEAEEFMRDHRGRAILRFKDLPGYPLE